MPLPSEPRPEPIQKQAQTSVAPVAPAIRPTDNPDAQPGPTRSWVVLGMHRSGTSFLTCLLNQMGGTSGPAESLLPAAPTNPLGFYEHREMMRINDELLRRRDSVWCDPPRLAETSWDTPDLEDLRQQAREFLARDFRGKAISIFKDPRLCLTFGFWAGLLPEPRVLLCLRRPSAVANSLWQRNGFDVSYSRWLWARHVRGALDGAGALLAGVVYYEELLADPVQALAPWAAALGFESFLASAQARQVLADFVRPDLNHAPAVCADDLDRSYERLRLGPRDLTGLAAGAREMADPILNGIPERPSAAVSGFNQIGPQSAAWWVTQHGLRARLHEAETRAQVAEERQRVLEGQLATAQRELEVWRSEKGQLATAQRELEVWRSERRRLLVRVAIRVEKLRRGER